MACCCRKRVAAAKTHSHHGRASTGATVSVPGSSSRGSHSNEEEPAHEIRTIRFHNPKGHARVFTDVITPGDVEDLNPPLKWGSFDQYEIIYEKLLGRGSYGEVYLATKLETGEECVAKKMVFKSTDDKAKILSRLQLEVNLQKRLKASPDILKIWDTVRDKDDNKYIILEYIQSEPYTNTFKRAAPDVVQFYLYHLLKAIDFCHSRGIVHKDIKGDNCLFDDDNKDFRLIDFGLSDFYRKDEEETKFPGSLVYKAPELFLEYTHYDYAVDMWAFGCVMAGIICQKFPHFFLPEIQVIPNESDHKRRKRYAFIQMREIIRLLGTQDYAVYAYKYRDYLRQKVRMRFDPALFVKEGCPRDRVSIKTKVDKKYSYLATDEAIDLLEKIFEYDHEKRITAREALKHEYFADLRKNDDKPVSSPGTSLEDDDSGSRTLTIDSRSHIEESIDDTADTAKTNSKSKSAVTSSKSSA